MRLAAGRLLARAATTAEKPGRVSGKEGSPAGTGADRRGGAAGWRVQRPRSTICSDGAVCRPPARGGQRSAVSPCSSPVSRTSFEAGTKRGNPERCRSCGAPPSRNRAPRSSRPPPIVPPGSGRRVTDSESCPVGHRGARGPRVSLRYVPACPCPARTPASTSEPAAPRLGLAALPGRCRSRPVRRVGRSSGCDCRKGSPSRRSSTWWLVAGPSRPVHGRRRHRPGLQVPDAGRRCRCLRRCAGGRWPPPRSLRCRRSLFGSGNSALE